MKIETIEDYEGLVAETAIYPREIPMLYVACGIAGEAGEVADKVKKLMRDKNLMETKAIVTEDKLALAKEVGDVMWYVTAAAKDLGYTLQEIMQMNADKLLKRKATGTLQGSGDNRELEVKDGK